MPENEDQQREPAQTTSQEPPEQEDPEISRRRSAVRVRVTYLAAGFLFVVGAGVVGYYLGAGQPDEAREVFLTILPVAASIVTYWFATRGNAADALLKLREQDIRRQNGGGGG